MSLQDKQALEHQGQQEAEGDQKRFLDGSEDAAFGKNPRYTDPTYLNGYINGLKKLPTNPDGTIQHYDHRQHFAFGYVDNPNPRNQEEF
ncbi:hypothetical protein BST81_03405 [Leptolyngbya sp. 'hensonii']|uniref:hypothetical protein n=1 Tax=Leptolyngbya sp. 'hensonii' TaxID=1922337 RepID=UPI000950187C|nr:hypothetical protein [Leptolyngbya sp. 'hensonii']OLP19833.1 hypothetical protein BST81_03405 [Leptolyngbya sp. 'hensonii']